MRVPWRRTVTISALVAILLTAWFGGSWLRLRSPDLWIFRGAVTVLGISALVAFLWMRSRKSSKKAAAPGGAGDVPTDQIDLLFHESQARLGASKAAAKLSGLPAVVVLGQAGGGKTTCLLRSELEPELLAGQVYQDNLVVPTRVINVWYARNAIFVDVGGAVLGAPDARARLFKRLRPRRWSSVFRGASQAPRAALVCVDCESFLQAGAAEATVASARLLREALAQACQSWGINLPVYVIFTRMDRVPYFSEFAGTLDNEEAGGIFGATVPLPAAADTGVYADQESRRLTAAFQSLGIWLTDRRPDLLRRENDPEKLSAVYQFPREFGKLRSLLIQFLVDLCRPSQLHTNPFLRGFYFAGVRAVIIRDVAVSAAPSSRQESLLTDATGIFQPGSKSVPDASAKAPVGRKVPQWVFLRNLFPAVILKDNAARSSSRVSIKAGFWRRALLAAATAAGLVYAIGATVSYFNNRDLEREALAAARAMPAASIGDSELASLEALQRLEALRVVASKLADHQRFRPPMSLRWGLYTGARLQPSVSRIYFGHFRSLLLHQTQLSLISLLARPSGAEALGYKPVYDALKAYLITTSNPEKSTVVFLPPVLLNHWTRGRSVDPGRLELARRQFAFYAEQLPIRNPYPSFAKPDEGAVRTARAYLAKFGAAETLYQAMVADASQKFATIRFNQQFPGSAEVVRNAYPVSGAFTKAGWKFMQEVIARPEQYFSGERWVMGDAAYANLDMAQLSARLQQLYQDDFLRQWREFLRNTSVVRYANVPDAASKLQLTSGIQSPLLLLLCVVSQNTAVDLDPVSEAFQPAQFVTPEGCQEKLAGSSNAGYMDGLIKLQASLQQLGTNAGSEPLRAEAISAATGAQVAARLTSQNFRIDKEGGTHALVQKLLEDPITYAQNALVGAPVEAINAAGRSFCADLRPLMAKYPFQPKASAQASVAEIAAIFQPGSGALWRLYEENLVRVLVRQGNEFVPAPGGIAVTEPFLAFFRRMAAVSDAFFREAGSPQPKLGFSLRPVPTEGVDSVTVTINGARSGAPAGGPWAFAWPGSGPQEARLQVKLTGGSELAYVNYSGLWAAFQFVATADRWDPVGSDFQLEWTLRTSVGDVLSPKTGKPVTVRLLLSTVGAPVLRPGYLATLNCVSNVARAR